MYLHSAKEYQFKHQYGTADQKNRGDLLFNP